MPRYIYSVGQAVRVRARHDAMDGRGGHIVRIRPWGVDDEITVEFHMQTGEDITLSYWDYEIEAPRLMLDPDEEESFWPGNPRDYGDSM